MASSVACGSSLKMATFEGLSARSLGLRGAEPVGAVDTLIGESPVRRDGRGSSVVTAGLKDLRDRIATVKNTQKITDAMKLVAAAKVRRAQEAVVNGRPFSENLVKVLYNVNEQISTDDIDIPLTTVRFDSLVPPPPTFHCRAWGIDYWDSCCSDCQIHVCSAS